MLQSGEKRNSITAHGVASCGLWFVLIFFCATIANCYSNPAFDQICSPASDFDASLPPPLGECEEESLPLSVLLGLVTASGINAQEANQSLSWSFTAVSANGSFIPTDLQVSASGMVYVVGEHNDETGADFGNSVQISGPEVIGNSSYIVAVDPGGTASWGRSIETGLNNSEFQGVSVDSSGSVYAAGGQDGVSFFDFGNGVTSTGPFSNWNVSLVKYSATGTPLWARTVSSGGGDSFFYDVSVDSTGQVIAVGYQTGTDTYNYGSGVTATGGAASPSSNAAIVWYDSSGNTLQARAVTTSSSTARTIFFSADSDNAGNTFAVGRRFSSALVNYSPFVSAGGGNPSSNNAVIVKYDSSREPVALRTTLLGGSDSVFSEVAVDSTGNVYVVGYQNGTSTYNYGSVSSASGSHTGSNAVIVKYNNNLSAQWARTVTSGNDNSLFDAVTVDASGNIHAVGYQDGTGNFSYGGSAPVAGADPNRNAVIVTFDPDGNVLAARSISAGSNRSVYSAAGAGSDGSLYYAGTQNGTSEFVHGSGEEAFSITGAFGGSNMVLIRKK